MSLYHEAASVLSQSGSEGGSLKSKIFSNKTLKSPKTQLYALALETCKWSGILTEVIDNSQLLQHERKVCFFFVLLYALHTCKQCIQSGTFLRNPELQSGRR